jgi:hypothetical protein
MSVSDVICLGGLCSGSSVKMRGDCSPCLYWYNHCIKLFFHNSSGKGWENATKKGGGSYLRIKLLVIMYIYSLKFISFRFEIFTFLKL